LTYDYRKLLSHRKIIVRFSCNQAPGLDKLLTKLRKTGTSKAADTRQTNVGQQMLDNSMAEMADSTDDDDVAAVVISVIARKRKRRRPKSVWVQSWIMQR